MALRHDDSTINIVVVIIIIIIIIIIIHLIDSLPISWDTSSTAYFTYGRRKNSRTAIFTADISAVITLLLLYIRYNYINTPLKADKLPA